MSQVKLFSSTGTRVARRSGKPKKQKVKKPLKTLAIWLLVILCLEALYFFCVYTNNSFVKKWRTIYINTAMDTMRHQWLATYFIPKDVIDEVRYEYGLVRAATVGKESNANWGKKDDTPAGTDTPAADDNVTHINPNITHESEQTEDNTPTAEELEKQAQENFYSVFWELDRTSMEAYLAEHPDTLANGWDQIYINEAGFDDEGTSIQSTFGEQVLAINYREKILLVHAEGEGYRGVLAVAKVPARLSLENAAQHGTIGQTVGEIAEETGDILAMSASRVPETDEGEGALPVGYAMSGGVGYGEHLDGPAEYGYCRVEISNDNVLSIVKTTDPVGRTCRDAVETQPALIVDGAVQSLSGWTEQNPRACLGQSSRREMLLLVIEGHNLTEGIYGAALSECAQILTRHGAQQAVNLAGGTSAILWYDGQCVTRCSNSYHTEGRLLPNAFVYHARTD